MRHYLGRKVRDRNVVNNVNDLELVLHKEFAKTPIYSSVHLFIRTPNTRKQQTKDVVWPLLKLEVVIQNIECNVIFDFDPSKILIKFNVFYHSLFSVNIFLKFNGY
jgi:hypothetical protein